MTARKLEVSDLKVGLRVYYIWDYTSKEYWGTVKYWVDDPYSIYNVYCMWDHNTVQSRATHMPLMSLYVDDQRKRLSKFQRWSQANTIEE